MIRGVPVPSSNGLMSCGFRAAGSVRSDGLLRRLASCELAGLTPGARPVVAPSVADGVEIPGTAEPTLLAPPCTVDPLLPEVALPDAEVPEEVPAPDPAEPP